jgi:ribosomal protein S7
MSIKYHLKLKESCDPYFIFYVAMLKITPEVFLVTLPLGSAKYSVPLPITEVKKISFAVK